MKKQNKAVIGAKVGDEGKGKIVDSCAEDSEIVARYEGGANAGHTITVGDFKFVGHLLPSGAAAGKICVLTKGVRVDPYQLIKEVDEFASRGGDLKGLFVDTGAFLSMPWHRILEWYFENRKGVNKAYTTGRGMCAIAGSIGLRLDPHMSMIFDDDELRRWLGVFYRSFEGIFQLPDVQAAVATSHEAGEVDYDHIYTPDEMTEYLTAIAGRMRPYVRDVRQYLFDAWSNQNKRILWEGAQGMWLDPYWGTWGNNTQGLCTFGGITVGSGLPIEAVGYKIGVDTAITHRVGNGPFPSELGDYAITDKEKRIPKDQRTAWIAEMREKINASRASDQEIGQYLRVVGNEYGATSGRPRRLGWGDPVFTNYFCQVNAPDTMALTKLDYLTGLETVKLVTGYRLGQSAVSPNQMPFSPKVWDQIRPEYTVLPGWDDDFTGETDFAKLPANARQYIETFEEIAGCHYGYISTGPDRAHLIVRQ